MKKKKFEVGIEFKDGTVIYFGGSKENLGYLVGLLARGLKLLRIKKGKKVVKF